MKEILSAGGYGFYLWMSYGMVLLCVALEVLSSRKRLSNQIKKILMRIRH